MSLEFMSLEFAEARLELCHSVPMAALEWFRRFRKLRRFKGKKKDVYTEAGNIVTLKMPS